MAEVLGSHVSAAERRWCLKAALMGLLMTLACGFSAELATGALPDGRAYELVSPPEKNGGSVMLTSSRNRAAAAGDAFAFASLVGFGEVQGTAVSTEYLARRGLGGWKTHGITPRQEPMSGLLVFDGPGDAIFEGEFSPDLNRGVVRANAFPSGDPNVSTVSNLFVRTNLGTPGSGPWSLVSESVVPIPPPWTGVTFPPPPEIVPSTYKPFFAAASADFRHVLFESILNLTQDAVDADLPRDAGDAKAYEWVDGRVKYVGILPEAEGGGIVRAVAGRGASGISPFHASDAISDDGARIFFTVPDTGQLYVREDGLRTRRVNVSEKSVPEPAPSAAAFRAATPDGSYVFFTTEEQLTEDDDNGGDDLYRANLDAPPGSRLTRLSRDGVPGDAFSPNVTGLLGVSDDGERAYFIAHGPMIADAPPVGLTDPVLYVWHGGTLSFVGTLADGVEERTSGAGTWGLTLTTSRVTPDGRFALFVTASVNQRVVNDHGDCGGRPCRQVYVFDAEANGRQGAATCVSCHPTGQPSSADASFLVHTGTGGSRRSSHRVQPLTADGRYVFFHTSEALLPSDLNIDFDVYEYDLASEELRLISSGSPEGGDAYFLDASASGRDVFLATRERLVGWDVDDAYDAYDARVNGGFPEPTRPLPDCLGRACQGEASGAPGARPTSSRAFRGSGNVRARSKKARRRCRRGKVRRRVGGRVQCVKKPRRARGAGVGIAGAKEAGR